MRSVLPYFVVFIVSVNSLSGILISEYDLFNVLIFNSSVIFPGASLYLSVGSERLETPFKVSLAVFSIISSGACCVMSLLSRPSFYDNYYFIVIAALVGANIVLANVFFVTSRSVEESIPYSKG